MFRFAVGCLPCGLFVITDLYLLILNVSRIPLGIIGGSTWNLVWDSPDIGTISISKLNYEYVELSNYVRALLPLKLLIKEVIDNLIIYS